ncbi:MAG TPA: gliding motility-associated C-terminal domain-containing protein [Bacteroidia bacterium]
MSISLFLSAATLYSQGENTEWIFGEGVHLSFKTGKPIGIYDMPKMKTEEGSTVVSDAGGNLLFYSDGLEVHDRTYTPMPNGQGLLGHKSSTSSAVAVPYPGQPSKYFLFCVDQNISRNNMGLSYNIIDMAANHGKGDVVLKNKVLIRLTDEKIAVTTRCGGDGHWVVIHKSHSDSFLAYSITNSGIDLNPVVSICKTSRNKFPEIGYMKFSPTGRYMVNANTLAERIELFQFDKISGKLSLLTYDETQYHRSLRENEQTYYGVAFSAQEKFIYVSTLESGEIFQYDLSVPENTFKTKTLIAELDRFAGAIQLGPDNMLYLADGYRSHYLHRIHYPELKGANCSFNKNFIAFDWKVTLNLGLPTFIENTINYYNLGQDIIVDATGPSEITLSAAIKGGKYLWSTGSTNMTIKVKDTGGIYWVKASDSNACMYYIDTIRVMFSKNFSYSGPEMPDKEYCSNADFPGIQFTSYSKISGFIWRSSNPFFGLPEYGRGSIKAFHLPYSNNYIYTTITVYPVKEGYVGKPFMFNITVLPSPEVDTNYFTHRSYCDGDTFKAVYLRGVPAWRQLVGKWYNLDGLMGLGDSGKSAIPSFVCKSKKNQSDTFRINAYVFEASCGSLPYELKVIIHPIPVMEKIKDISICSGNILPELELNSMPKETKYAYGLPQFGGRFIETDLNILKWIPIPKINKLFEQNIVVRPQLEACIGEADTFKLRIMPVPLAAFEYNIVQPDTNYASATYLFNNKSKGYTSYEWQINEEHDSSNFNKIVTLSNNQAHNVTLTSYNEYGCSNEQTQSIFEERRPMVFVPNAFSPNNDGINDRLRIVSMGMQTWTIRIFNAWGEMVYEGNQAQTYWDGSYQNRLCIAGNYVWQMESTDQLGQTYEYRGTLMLCP